MLPVSRNIITIHLCHGRLVFLCIQQQTSNKPVTILLPIYKQHVDGNRTHVAGNMLPWCKRSYRQTDTCHSIYMALDMIWGYKDIAFINLINAKLISSQRQMLNNLIERAKRACSF